MSLKDVCRVQGYKYYIIASLDRCLSYSDIPQYSGVPYNAPDELQLDCRMPIAS